MLPRVLQDCAESLVVDVIRQSALPSTFDVRRVQEWTTEDPLASAVAVLAHYEYGLVFARFLPSR